MISAAKVHRKLAVALALAGLGGGLAVAAAGSADAAVPDAWGYALVLNPSGPVNAAHWKESVASPTPTASPGLPGQVTVTFPNIGFFKQGVVHVTAIIDELAWCQAQTWGPLGGSEKVVVRCYTKGGVPTFVPFTVLFTTSSGTLPGGLAYAYLHETTTGVVSSFNSTGAANTVAPIATGVWNVTLPGAGPATQSGGVQVTAVNPTKPAICDVAHQAWATSRQVIQVRCYNPAGLPENTGWTLTYQRSRAITGARPRVFAYTLNNKPLVAGPYAPVPPGVNVNSAGGLNLIRRAAFAAWLIILPRVGVLPNTVMVTADSTVPRVCNLNTTWATALGPGTVTIRDVACYRVVTGALVPAASFVSYSS